jgi:hypothetical protein
MGAVFRASVRVSQADGALRDAGIRTPGCR